MSTIKHTPEQIRDAADVINSLAFTPEYHRASHTTPSPDPNLTPNNREELMTITPNAMPKKANAIHLQILSGLLATKPASWVKKTLVQIDGKDEVVKTTITREEPRFALSQNVSGENIDRVAKRWSK
ncbi:hypothetical protein SEA_PAINTERBOY_67 [Mycobacterium phage PainterBoy]|nr:hypothetical protein SEA_PAINTERBOY_67 [Mycobacterium phage PainterBoy]